jgi:hypothetical protein
MSLTHTSLMISFETRLPYLPRHSRVWVRLVHNDGAHTDLDRQ